MRHEDATPKSVTTLAGRDVEETSSKQYFPTGMNTTDFFFKFRHAIGLGPEDLRHSCLVRSVLGFPFVVYISEYTYPSQGHLD